METQISLFAVRDVDDNTKTNPGLCDKATDKIMEFYRLASEIYPQEQVDEERRIIQRVTGVDLENRTSVHLKVCQLFGLYEICTHTLKEDTL